MAPPRDGGDRGDIVQYVTCQRSESIIVSLDTVSRTTNRLSVSLRILTAHQSWTAHGFVRPSIYEEFNLPQKGILPFFFSTCCGRQSDFGDSGLLFRIHFPQRGLPSCDGGRCPAGRRCAEWEAAIMASPHSDSGTRRGLVELRPI